MSILKLLKLLNSMSNMRDTTDQNLSIGDYIYSIPFETAVHLNKKLQGTRFRLFQMHTNVILV